MSRTTPSAPVRSYLEDVMAAGPVGGYCDPGALAGAPTVGGLTEFSGSYGLDECPQGMLGGAEYYRAFRESEVARMAPDVLARAVRSTWDEPFLSIITPEKPAAVSLAGYDVFGPQSFSTTTRHMTTDLRGEAAYAPALSGDVPVGASVASDAMGAAMDYSDCAQGCGCQANPAGVQLGSSAVGGGGRAMMEADALAGARRGSACAAMCHMTSADPADRAQCLRQCGMDVAVPAQSIVARAGSLDDLRQDCVSSCAADGGSAGEIAACVATCGKLFGASVAAKTGRSVRAVYGAAPDSGAFYTPARVQGVTILRPYHV